MTEEKIQELFDKHTVELTYTDNTMRVMNEYDFADAINQAELEWYKELEKNLCSILDDYDITCDLYNYHKEIKNKIKELENEN